MDCERHPAGERADVLVMVVRATMRVVVRNFMLMKEGLFLN